MVNSFVPCIKSPFTKDMYAHICVTDYFPRGTKYNNTFVYKFITHYDTKIKAFRFKLYVKLEGNKLVYIFFKISYLFIHPTNLKKSKKLTEINN